jgi:hypothetical protein
MQTTSEFFKAKSDFSESTNGELIFLIKMIRKARASKNTVMTDEDNKTFSEIEAIMRSRNPGYDHYLMIYDLTALGKPLEDVVNTPVLFPYNTVEAAKKLIKDIENGDATP